METHPPKDPSATNGTSAATSELNNLLEIISGTSAAKVTAQLVQHAGGSEKKVLFHPELASFARQKNTAPTVEKKRSILIVDDEPMALVLAKRILSEAGFEIVTAQSGFECLDLFRTRPAHFDLILLDLTMPFMDGEEVFGRLRSVRPDVVVLLNTDFIAQEQLDRMLRAGIAGFLRKPHGPDELVANIRAALKGVEMSPAGCAADAVTSSL